VLYSSTVRIRVRIRFSGWLVNCYAHAFVPLSVVIVTLPPLTVMSSASHDDPTLAEVAFLLFAV